MTVLKDFIELEFVNLFALEFKLVFLVELVAREVEQNDTLFDKFYLNWLLL